MAGVTTASAVLCCAYAVSCFCSAAVLHQFCDKHSLVMRYLVVMSTDIPSVLATDRRCRPQAAQCDVHGAGHEEVRKLGVWPERQPACTTATAA